MKKVVLIAILAITGVWGVKAQENVIKMNPLGLAFGSIDLSYEKALNGKSSIEIGVAYSSLNVTTSGSSSKATGFGVEGKYKMYFSNSGAAPRGWYGAPFVNYSKTTVTGGDLSAFSGGVLGGYQWIFGGSATGFALDLNFGAQYVSANTSGSIISTTFDGILPRLGLSLGYAW